MSNWDGRILFVTGIALLVWFAADPSVTHRYYALSGLVFVIMTGELIIGWR